MLVEHRLVLDAAPLVPRLHGPEDAAAALHECEYEDEPGKSDELRALSRVVGKIIHARGGMI